MINLETDIIVKSDKWQQVDNILDHIAAICDTIIPLTDFAKLSQDELEIELSISLVDDAQIREINAEFRHKDKATNVLSFPSLDEALIREKGLDAAIGGAGYVFLGDIVIAYETLEKESLAQKKHLRDHLTHLILHSLLHLIGYDHEDDQMAEEMESLEITILKQLGIANPYINQ